MLKLFKNKVKKIIASKSGMSTYILMFSLAPVVLVVLLLSIDLNIYLLTRSQLQNALDTVAESALARSTNDTYRSDKVLKVVTSVDDSRNYANRLKEGIIENFKPTDNYIETEWVGAKDATLNCSPECKIYFIPGFKFTPDPAELDLNYKPGGGQEYVSGNLNTSYGTNTDIELSLKGNIVLPTLGKFFGLFGNTEIFKAGVTVNSAVRGIRVITPDDFSPKPWQ